MDAIVTAVERLGGDGHGKDGLDGRMFMMARFSRKRFGIFLERALRLRMKASPAHTTPRRANDLPTTKPPLNVGSSVYRWSVRSSFPIDRLKSRRRRSDQMARATSRKRSSTPRYGTAAMAMARTVLSATWSCCSSPNLRLSDLLTDWRSDGRPKWRRGRSNQKKGVPDLGGNQCDTAGAAYRRRSD